MTPPRHLVVLAGADPTAVDALAATLREDGSVRTAYSLDALFESLDEEVDVALVDRALPDESVAAVVAEVRERAVDCQVAVVASEQDLRSSPSHGADAAVAWEGEAARETVDRLATRARYRDRLEEFYDLAEQRAALDSDEESAVDRLDRHLDRLRRDLNDGFDRLDGPDAFEAALSRDERHLGDPDE
ncbi:MAG: hypothetical protein ABEJ26_07145 [Halosimplex sp.]